MYKSIYLILFMFCFSYANAEVYYCSEKTNGGFTISGKTGIVRFPLGRFKINMDIYQPSVDSKDLYFPKDFTICTYPNAPSNTFYCFSNLGTAFSFDTKSKKFIYAKVSLFDNHEDSNNISWGTCESF